MRVELVHVLQEVAFQVDALAQAVERVPTSRVLARRRFPGLRTTEVVALLLLHLPARALVPPPAPQATPTGSRARGPGRPVEASEDDTVHLSPATETGHHPASDRLFRVGQHHPAQNVLPGKRWNRYRFLFSVANHFIWLNFLRYSLWYLWNIWSPFESCPSLFVLFF